MHRYKTENNDIIFHFQSLIYQIISNLNQALSSHIRVIKSQGLAHFIIYKPGTCKFPIILKFLRLQVAIADTKFCMDFVYARSGPGSEMLVTLEFSHLKLRKLQMASYLACKQNFQYISQYYHLVFMIHDVIFPYMLSFSHVSYDDYLLFKLNGTIEK